MAKAIRDVEYIEVEQTVYRLTLNRDELEALGRVLYNVGGDPSTGRRHIDAILDAVGKIRTQDGIQFYDSGRRITKGEIEFVQ